MIHPYLKEFIEQNINLIDSNEFIKLYLAWCDDNSRPDNILFHEVYSMLIEAGIDPLLHMNVIPFDYFLEYEANELIIPEGVHTIQKEAFSECKLNRLVIPSSVKQVSDYLFVNSSIKMIEWHGSPSLSDFALDGTDFEGAVFKIEQGSSIDRDLNAFTVPNFTIDYL